MQMGRKKRKGVSEPAYEELQVAKWMIRRYERLKKNEFYFREGSKGHDPEDTYRGAEKSYKTQIDIANHCDNVRIIECIEYVLEEYVAPQWQQKVWDLSQGRIKRSELDDYERASVVDQYRTMLIGFCKEYGLDTTTDVE